MMSIKSRLEDVLAGIISKDGSDPRDLYVTLYHGKDERLQSIIADAMRMAQREGRVSKCPNNGGHRHSSLRYWDMFVDGGIEALSDYRLPSLLRPVQRHLAQVYRHWTRDPQGAARAAHPECDCDIAVVLSSVEGLKTITHRDISAVAVMLSHELLEPRSRLAERISGEQRSRIDDRPIDVRFEGWTPVLYEWQPNYQGTMRAELPTMNPAARHYEISTNGKLVIFGRKDFGGLLDQAIRKVEDELPYSGICSDIGANQSALATYAATGMLEIHLGDCFPQIIRDGNVIRGNWIGQDDCPAPCELLFDTGLHMPIMGCLDKALALVEAAGLDPAQAELEIVGSYGATVIDVEPGTLHIYGPDGWRLREFAETFDPAGLEKIPNGLDAFYICSEPLTYNGECLDVDMLGSFDHHAPSEEL